MDKVLISPDKFDEWLLTPHPEITFTKEASDIYQIESEKFDLETNRNDNLDLDLRDKARKFAGFNQINFETELLMKKFGINPKYKNIIIKAIVCGVIQDDDLTVEDKGFEYDFLFDPQELRSAVERIFKGTSKSGKKLLDRDREWLYAFRKSRGEGLSYEKSIQALADKENIDNEEIEQQLKRYRKFLRN